MTDLSLKVYIAQTYLPEVKTVRSLVEAAGGSYEGYKNWENVAVSTSEEHPSDMGTRALKIALEKISLDPSELSVIFSVGMSRDYLPSFSVAAEIMKNLEISGKCFGIDLTLGCLGVLVGLDIAESWLRSHSGKYAAIVCSEKQNWTIDYKDAKGSHLRGYGDGAGVFIVGIDETRDFLGTYQGGSYYTIPSLNGTILDKYGGTKFPIAPAGEKHRREVRAKPQDVLKGYSLGYTSAINQTLEKSKLTPDWVVCNQVAPNMCLYLSSILKMPKDKIIMTGPEFGHLGGTDIIIGVQKLVQQNQLTGNILIVSSMPHSWGSAFLKT